MMKTTLWVYIGVWALIAVPLILFNLKKCFPKTVPEGRHCNIKNTITVAVVFVIVSAFMLCSYNVTVNTRYELLAEECVEAHAEYLLGKKDSKELMDTLSPLLDEDIKDEVSASDFGDFAIYKDGEISYQTGDQVIPDNYSKKSFASDIKVIDSENPILLYYRLKTDDDNISVWRLILERQSNKTLKISDIHKVTKSEELSFSKVYLPKSDTWVTVS